MPAAPGRIEVTEIEQYAALPRFPIRPLAALPADKYQQGIAQGSNDVEMTQMVHAGQAGQPIAMAPPAHLEPLSGGNGFTPFHGTRRGLIPLVTLT